MDRIDDLIEAQGVVLVREHPELASAISRRFRQGRLRRLHPGVYAAPGPVSEGLRLVALSRWAPRAVLHGATGAALWLDGWTGGVVDLANPVRLVTPPGVRLTLRTLPAEHVWRLRGVAVASAAYCAAELAAVDDGHTAMRMFLTGATTAGNVADAARSLCGTPGNTARHRVVKGLAANPWSPAERLLHELLRKAGITSWAANETVRVDGRRLHPDVLMCDRPLVIEVDGYAFHGGREAFQRDRERLNLFAQAGFTVLRFTWEDLTVHPEQVITTVRRTLRGMNLHLDPSSAS